MPIGPMYIPESDPWSGQKSVAQIIGQAAQTRQTQQSTEQTRLANAMVQAQLPYAGQMAQANLAYTQAQAPNLQAQTQRMQQMTPLEAQQLQLQNKYYPAQQYLNALQTSQVGNRFGQSYQLSKALSSMHPAAREEWIGQNQEQYAQMLNDLANQNQGGTSINPQLMKQYFPEFMGQPSQGMPPQQNIPISNQPPMSQQPENVTPTNAIPPLVNGKFKPSTPEQVAVLKKANEMGANNALTTAATKRQMEGAIQVQSMVNDPALHNRVVNASQYAGALRKGGAVVDALSQTNPRAYMDYLQLKNYDMVLLENRIKTLDQMGGTDKQREELKGFYKKTMDSLTSNPSQFITQFNNLRESLDNVARGVQKSASPLVNINRLEKGKPAPNPYLKAIQGNIVTIQSPTGDKFTGTEAQIKKFLKDHPDHKRVG